MLDPLLKRLAAPALQPAAQPLAGLGADLVSILGFAVGLAAIPAIAGRSYLLGLALLLLNRVIDALDGVVARQAPADGQGAFLDMTLDLIVFAGLPFAFALSDPAYGIAAAFLTFGIAAAGATSVFSAVQTNVIAGFIARTMEDTELTLAFVVACLAPQWFAVIAYVAGVLCFVTAGARIAFTMGRSP